MPRLTRWLQQLRITPPKQIDIKFRTVMEWAPLVRTEDAVSILEQEFFGKWESALRHWLQSAKTSPGEADAWCTGWKKLVTPELLAENRGLAHVEAGLENGARGMQHTRSQMFQGLEGRARRALSSICNESISSPLVPDDAGYLSFFTRKVSSMSKTGIA